MMKLRFKNRNGILYFGVGDKFKSSKMKYTNINKNILSGKFRDGYLDKELFDIDTKTSPLLTDLLQEVMNSKSISLKHKSLLTYSSVSRNNIIPYFENKNVINIKPTDIRKWHSALIEKGLKRQLITIARVLMKEAFELAMINEIIDTNPIKIVDMPKMKQTRKKQRPFSLDEIDLILKTAKGMIRNFIGISFFTGMRSGELLALKWEDVDFETDTISITKTVAEGLINSPKTPSSFRDIEMIPKSREFFKNQQLQTGMNKEYIFLNRKNTHYGNNSTIYANFCAVLKEAEIEHRSLHNTRHSFASIMLNNGIEPLWVSNTLGHENLDITLRIYTHFMPRKEKMVIGFLEKRYKSGTVG